MQNPTSASSETPETPKTKVALPVVAALALCGILAGGNIYLLNKTGSLEGQIKDLSSSVKTELTDAQKEYLVRGAEVNKVTSELRQKIEETGVRSQRAAQQATSSASAAAKKYSEELNKKIAEQEQTLQENHRLLTAQLGEMRTEAGQTTEKVNGVATDVTTVKTEVAQTKSDIEKTLSDLRSVRGDLGVQSGLIATNSKELAALRALGERDYVEFELTKTKAPQKVGDVALQLKKSDLKRNRYTLELIANDKRMEKRDRSVNEPVQFYMAKARIPYELVVNEVKNDRIVGYLAAPKVRDPR
jgi:chromosome segregation ATPase